MFEYALYVGLGAAGFGIDRLVLAVRAAKQATVVVPLAAVVQKAKRPYVRKVKPAVETALAPQTSAGYVNGSAKSEGAGLADSVNV